MLEEAGVSIGFDNLDIAAVEEMAGLLADGSPVRDVLARRFPDNWEQAEDALLQGIAKGWNPRKVAAAMTSRLGGALSDAARIARTEQLRAYREASRNAYVESGVVEQYKRLATHDTRTCIACIVLDGRIYPTSEPLSDHPNGRCSMVPIVKNRPEPRWESGKTWFNGLDADDHAVGHLPVVAGLKSWGRPSSTHGNRARLTSTRSPKWRKTRCGAAPSRCAAYATPWQVVDPQHVTRVHVKIREVYA